VKSPGYRQRRAGMMWRKCVRPALKGDVKRSAASCNNRLPRSPPANRPTLVEGEHDPDPSGHLARMGPQFTTNCDSAARQAWSVEFPTENLSALRCAKAAVSRKTKGVFVA